MQKKKHIRKQSKAYRIQRCEDALKFNPMDQSAQDALIDIKHPTKKGKEDYGN